METFYAKMLAKAGYKPMNWIVGEETATHVVFYHWQGHGTASMAITLEK